MNSRGDRGGGGRGEGDEGKGGQETPVYFTSAAFFLLTECPIF